MNQLTGHLGRIGVLWAVVLAGSSRADFSYSLAIDGTITTVDSVVPGPGGVTTQLAPGLSPGIEVTGAGTFVTDADGQLLSADLKVATAGSSGFGFTFVFDPAADRGIFGGSLPLVVRGGGFASDFPAIAGGTSPTDLIRQFILVESSPDKGYLNIDLEHRTSQGTFDYYVDARLPAFRVAPRSAPEPTSLVLVVIGLAAFRACRRRGAARA